MAKTEGDDCHCCGRPLEGGDCADCEIETGWDEGDREVGIAPAEVEFCKTHRSVVR